MHLQFFTRLTFLLAVVVMTASCGSSRNTSSSSRLPGSFPGSIPGTTRTADSLPSTESLPPGQAKKVYGQKSAKAFAPGQQKKKGQGKGKGKQKGKKNK